MSRIGVFALVGVLIIGVSVPLICRKVPPNEWYGFRTKKTLSDPTIWYAANRTAGIDLILAGLAILVACLLSVIIKAYQPEFPENAFLFLVVVGSLVTAALHSYFTLPKQM